MGRAPCCEKGLRKGPWDEEEDKILIDFITKNNGHGNWKNLPKLAGLLRCGKSCRLRWNNYLRPDIRRGPFSPEEEKIIIQVHNTLGNRWAAIASQLQGRTDNDVKNFWNTHIKKRYSKTIINQPSPPKSADIKSNLALTSHMDKFQSVWFNAPSSSTSGGDYFVRMWNSEIGKSFRDVKAVEWNGALSHSPASQTSSLTKVESTDKKVGILTCKKEAEELEVYSDLTKICEFDDSSSDAMMKLLLDYPVGGGDMGFLEGRTDDFVTYLHEWLV